MDTRYENVEERKLVRLASSGDKVAFGELYQRYVDRIYNYCYYRMGNQQDAEDLTGRVFMKALGHIKNYDERGVPFSAWLYRIAHNLVANWHRDNGRHKVIPIDEYLVSRNPEDAPESLAEQSEEERQLMAAVRHLPEDRQQLLFLKFVEKLSNAEIGDLMNRTEGAIKSLYHRTLSALHDDMVARGIANIKALGTNRRKSQTN
jgi:RNA polymerase sigma-70 factor, ECF subfamily